MKGSSRIFGVTVAVVVAGAAWQRVGSAQTESATGVAYSGYLEDAGVAVDGTRNIGINLWNSTTTSDVTNRVCQQAAEGTTVSTGWFTVALGKSCADALRRYPSLQLEFLVEGTAFPLQPIGAVPYALRALEYNSGSRLRRIVRTGSDGSKQQDGTRWWDSLRGEECTFTSLHSGSPKDGLCLPALADGGEAETMYCLYVDSKCSIPFMPEPGGFITNDPGKYMYSPTSSSGLAEPDVGQAFYSGCAGESTCTLVSLKYYLPAVDIPASAFVSWTESFE